MCSNGHHRHLATTVAPTVLTATTAASDYGGPAASEASFAGSPGRGGPGGASRPGDNNGEDPRQAGGLGGVVSTPQRKERDL
jgi:hypothetical protein